MVHAIKIELAPVGPRRPRPADQAAKLGRLRDQMDARLTSLQRQRGGEALAEQAEAPHSRQGRAERDSPDHVRTVRRFAGDKDEVLQAARDAVQGAAWYRIWYHACRNDERQPCGKWELVENMED